MWLRVDDGFADHPKVIGLSDAAVAAWVRGLCYVARYETDGYIKTEAVRALTRKQKAVDELVTAGLWDANGSGYWVHDYLDYNPSKAQRDEERERRRVAGRVAGLASARTRREA